MGKCSNKHPSDVFNAQYSTIHGGLVGVKFNVNISSSKFAYVITQLRNIAHSFYAMEIELNFPCARVHCVCAFFPVWSVMVENFEIRKLHANTLANLLMQQQQQSMLAVVHCSMCM